MYRLFYSSAAIFILFAGELFGQFPTRGIAPSYVGGTNGIAPVYPGATTGFAPSFGRVNALQTPYFVQRHNIILQNNIRRREQQQLLSRQRKIDQQKESDLGPLVAENGDIRGKDNDGDGRIEPIHKKGHWVRGHYAASEEKKYKEQPEPRRDGPLVAENGDIRGEDNDDDGEVEVWYIETHRRKGHYAAARR
jgi:hypothetical protein